MIKGKAVFPLIILSLVFLFNPNVNLIDVLPDTVAYLILILIIGSLSEAVPYLAECKAALIKLALVTFIKIPSFTIMHSNMVSGKDIVPLFTLVFAVLELILLYSAVENGFKALTYIGERTDCSSVRDPFRVGKKNTFTPDDLKILTFIFIVAKAALSVIPELLLLTPEDVQLRKKLAESYPIVLVISILTGVISGVIWLIHSIKYVSAINQAKDLNTALNILTVRGTPEEICDKDKLKKIISSLSILAFSSIFIFDIIFSDLGEYNKLPHFIYGILLFSAVYSFSNNKRIKNCLIISTTGFSLASLLVYLFTERFFESYTYLTLSLTTGARTAYLPVKIFATIEAVFAIFMLVCASLATVDFIREHTDVAPSDLSYSKTNERNHKATVKKVVPIFIISGVINLFKLANVFIKQTTTLIYSEVNPEGIVASSFPAMDTIIFFVCILYVIYSFVAISTLKDEVKFKYSKE